MASTCSVGWSLWRNHPQQQICPHCWSLHPWRSHNLFHHHCWSQHLVSHAMFLMNYLNNITNIVLKQNLIINRCTMSSSGDITWASEATQQKRSVKTLHRMGGSLAYGSNGQLFDIAIIEVNTPFNLTSSVVAAKLPTARTSAKTNLVVSGWGTTTEGKGPMQYLLPWRIENIIKNFKSF